MCCSKPSYQDGSFSLSHRHHNFTSKLINHLVTLLSFMLWTVFRGWPTGKRECGTSEIKYSTLEQHRRRSWKRRKASWGSFLPPFLQKHSTAVKCTDSWVRLPVLKAIFHSYQLWNLGQSLISLTLSCLILKTGILLGSISYYYCAD